MPEPAAFTGSAEFPIDASDLAVMERTWERDDMHMPFPLAPLAADYVTRVIGASFNHHYERFGGTQTLEARVWHGYAYFGFSWNVPAEDEDAARDRWTAVVRERIAATPAYWRDEAVPALQRIYASLDAVPVDELAPRVLVDAWRRAWVDTLDAWRIHFVSIMGPYQVLEDLADQYATAVGAGRDVEALSLIRGDVHELEEVEAGIEALAAMLGASRVLAAAVAAQARSDIDERQVDRDVLRAAPAGPAFVAALDDFLRLHGHLGQNHDDLAIPSWAEAPVTLLRSLSQRAGMPGGAESRLVGLRQVAAERAAAVRATLAAKPDELARFEATLAQACEIGYLTEGHNYWIDRMAQARLRGLVTRVGRRLVQVGVLDRVDDVFFLGADDVADAILDGAPRQVLVRERRAELERQRTLTPPQYVGPIPEEQGAPDRFDSARIAPTVENELRGTGASAGLVRGPARVILSQDDFARVRQGDIIVAPASNPSWVPVFTIAGGLVTNTGGVLSHAAVVAREFGLPAVVGATEATARIADGRLLEIDGTAGTVRLL
ncbi:MAG TPA: PEP-utilizing enzyme [Candidatus Dormibacteraeota bacterium]|nr:PEP-utilizing enzyme [Candidatus Dormibacteraeota bacterium]